MYKILSTCKGGGYVYCRTDPPHPKRNAKGLYPLHRVILANKLGRDLLTDEIAHHKDGNKYNNDSENIILITRSYHSKIHSKKIKLIELICPQCFKKFYLKPFQYRARMKWAKKQPCCSYRCSGFFNKQAGG